MRDAEESPFLVGADQPVNRRTAKPAAPAPAAKLTPHLKARLQHLEHQSTMGAPLAQLLLSPAPVAGDAGHAMRMKVYLATAASAIAAVVSGAIVTPPLAYLLATGFALTAVVVAVVGLRAARRSTPVITSWSSGISSEHLRALDTALEQAASALRPPELELLQRLKGSLVAVAQAAQSASPAHWSADNQGWLVQCVGRYLPDSLHAYLSIPKEHRDHLLQGGDGNAHELLQSQLHSLQRHLDKLHAQLVNDKAERLLMQQRFLAAKEKGL